MANVRRAPRRGSHEVAPSAAPPSSAAVSAILYPPIATVRSAELLTVETAAEQLKLHPKTVLRFIRDGRLRATRVGKSYRILRSDLDELAGVPAPPEPSASAAWVTTIVDIPGVAPEMAKKWARTVSNAVQAKPGGAPMRTEVVHEPDRAHLKIILIGTPRDTVALLGLIQIWLDQLRP